MTESPLIKINNKIENSFSLIRKDISKVQDKVQQMRTFLRRKDNEYTQLNEKHKKSQDELQKDIDEFTQKIIQIKLAFSQINAIKQELVIKKDLARIEERIKISFSRDIEKYKTETLNLREELKESQKRIKALEKGRTHTSKKSWFNKN